MIDEFLETSARVYAPVAITGMSIGIAYLFYTSLPAEPLLMSKPLLGVIWGWAVGVGTMMLLDKWWFDTPEVESR